MTRKLDDLIDKLDERAVSPVIGVILMVAITVILAAVIGTFVLDLGQTAGNSAPQASLSGSVDTDANSIELTHEGGDAIQSDQVKIVVRWGSNSATYDSGSGETFTVGDQTTLQSNSVSGTLSSLSHSDDALSFTSGVQVEVTVIDTESQRTIWKTTITA